MLGTGGPDSRAEAKTGVSSDAWRQGWYNWGHHYRSAVTSHQSLCVWFSEKWATLQVPDCTFFFCLSLSFSVSCSILLRHNSCIFWIFLLHCLVFLPLSIESCSFHCSFWKALIPAALWFHLQWFEPFVDFNSVSPFLWYWLSLFMTFDEVLFESCSDCVCMCTWTGLRNQPYVRADGGRRSYKWKPAQKLQVSSDISL